MQSIIVIPEVKSTKPPKGHRYMTQAEYDAWVAQNEAYEAKADERAWQAIRLERDALIKATDWAVLPDSPHNTQAVLDYRQALRDLPQTFASPDEVVWPDNPLEA